MFAGKLSLPTNIFFEVAERQAKRWVVRNLGSVLGIEAYTKLKIWEVTAAGITSPHPAGSALVIGAGQFQSDITAPKGLSSTATLYVEIDQPVRASKLPIFIPPQLRDMQPMQPLLGGDNSLLDVIQVVDNVTAARIGLNLTEDGMIGIELTSPDESCQNIPYAVPLDESELRKALTFVSNFYHHLDRHNNNVPPGNPYQTSRFSLEMYKVVKTADGWLPASENLIVEKDGKKSVTIKVTDNRPGEELDSYGFTFQNNSNQPVFPYIFYFEHPSFGISQLHHHSSRSIILTELQIARTPRHWY